MQRDEDIPDMSRGGTASRLWWWIVLACLVHVAAWTGWIVLAERHPVEEVPLRTRTLR